jgi:hypothetical protein
VLFVVGFVEYCLNTTMYSFDPGFQVTEVWIPTHIGFRYAARFLVGVCLMIIIIFSTRVYIFWPTLINRHKNNFVFSIIFFVFTFFNLFRDEIDAMASSGKYFIIMTATCNLYIISMQLLFTLSKQGEKDIANAPNLAGMAQLRRFDGPKSPNHYETVNTTGEIEDDFDDTLKPEDR